MASPTHPNRSNSSRSPPKFSTDFPLASEIRIHGMSGCWKPRSSGTRGVSKKTGISTRPVPPKNGHVFNPQQNGRSCLRPFFEKGSMVGFIIPLQSHSLELVAFQGGTGPFRFACESQLLGAPNIAGSGIPGGRIRQIWTNIIPDLYIFH